MSAQPAPQRYTGAEIATGVLLTLFFPPSGLIAALVLLNGESNPEKRSALRSTAWVSGGLMVLDVLVLIVLAGV